MQDFYRIEHLDDRWAIAFTQEGNKEPVAWFLDKKHDFEEYNGVHFQNTGASYYVSTIMNHKGMLDLWGDVPTWKVSAEAMDVARPICKDEYDTWKANQTVNSSRKVIKSARFIVEDENGIVIGEADTYEEAQTLGGTVIDTQQQIQSSANFEKVRELSHEIAKGILSEEISLQEAVSRVMDELNCDEKYALTCVYSWIENEPTYNGTVMTSSREIKSSVSASELKDNLEGNFWTQKEDFESDVTNSGWDVDEINDEYATISNEKGSQYEVKFVRGGNTFTVDSFESIYIDEDDDEIESSRKPKTPVKSNKGTSKSEFVKLILSGRITEEAAARIISTKENCNLGYAKKILSNYMTELKPKLIASGLYDIAEDLNKEFDPDGDIDEWIAEFVPNSGKASTVGGELLRAFAQIRGRFLNDGDKIGSGYGNETVNPAARYITDQVEMGVNDKIYDMLAHELKLDDEDYQSFIDSLEKELSGFLRDVPEVFQQVNKDDMWNHKDASDQDITLNEVGVEGDDSTYWFQNNGNDWVCSNIEMDNAEYSTGDNIQIGDSGTEDIELTEDYSSFILDGVEYSVEAIDDVDEDGNHNQWYITNASPYNAFAFEGDRLTASELNPELLRERGYHLVDVNGNELSENEFVSGI